MYKSVKFKRLENPTGPTAWEIVRLGKPMPRQYDTLDEALTYAELCYDHPGDRDIVFVREVRTDPWENLFAKWQEAWEKLSHA